MEKVYDLEINNKKYKYALLHLPCLNNFLTNYNLKTSIEEIIKEHKSYYDLKKIILDFKNHQKNNRQTILFILFNIFHNEVCHIERLVFSNKSNSCYIDFVHTKKSYQNQGIGYLALYYLIENTKNKFKIYELKVRKTNVNAIKLYTKHKIKIIREIKQEIKQENNDKNKINKINNINKTIDVLIMVKKIE